MFLNCKYYIDEDFTTEFSNIDYHFSILHFNSRSLNIHFNALSYFICTLCIDFSETWINDSTPPLSISQKKRVCAFSRVLAFYNIESPNFLCHHTWHIFPSILITCSPFNNAMSVLQS